MKNVLIGFLVFWTLSGFAQLPKIPKKQISDSLMSKVDSNLLSIPRMRKPMPIYTDYDIQKKDLSALITFIDSVKNSAAYVNYIDPEDIANINVFKNKDYPNGVIYITLTNHNLLLKLLNSKLLSIKDITNKYIAKKENQKPIIFLLNKELVTDTTGVRIPSVCLANITVAQAYQMPYFKTTFPDALIMMITTHPISNKLYKPDILIRGMAN